MFFVFVTLNEITNMFIRGGASLSIPIQEAFTLGITHAFLLSAILTIPAIILSGLRGTEERQRKARNRQGIFLPSAPYLEIEQRRKSDH
jgi:hypothetical protein